MLRQHLKWCQGHTGNTELSGFEARVRGLDFSQTEMLTKAIVFWLRLLPAELAGKNHI